MATRNNFVYNYTITNSGGTLSLVANEPYNLYRLTGTPTLSSNFTVSDSGAAATGTEYRILYDATVNLNGNTMTIFGASIPADLTNVQFEVRAYHQGSGVWKTNILVDFESIPFITGNMIEDDTIETVHIQDDAIIEDKILDAAVTKNKIANDAITTVKIEDEAVTAAKLNPAAKKEVLIVPISFDSGEQSENTFTIPYDFKITSIRYTVTKVIAGTDAASISLSINGVAMTPGSISIPASTLINTTSSTNITATNTGTANQQVKVTSAKATAGGKALLTINLERV